MIIEFQLNTPQSLNVEGDPIHRLYTSGELGSFFGHLYQGGSNLPEALAFGRIAGSARLGKHPGDQWAQCRRL